MPKYWMITNRNPDDPTGLGNKRVEKIRFYTSSGGPIDHIASWNLVKDEGTTPAGEVFAKALAAKAGEFTEFKPEEHEQQKHVTLFVHGYNNDWKDAARRYQLVNDDIYNQHDLGICVLFTWPSNGQTAHYLSDRDDARASGQALSQALNLLYDHASKMELLAYRGRAVCKAKVSVIAHSMGNWVLQNALKYTWERYNKPLLVSLINQCVMVAADVDNDLFAGGESVGSGGAEGMANLCYRITALYSGKDSVLGMSAGFKHFGKRRLGRSGLDKEVAQPDNVWDFDCSALFRPTEKDIHSAYFWSPKIQNVLKDVLRGKDRGIINKAHLPKKK